MAVIGVVGVAAPLDFPDSQLGDSVNCDEANDGRRSLISNIDDEKLSDNEGQSRGDDRGEYRWQSVSRGGRWASKAEPMVAISRGMLCWHHKKALKVSYLDEY